MESAAPRGLRPSIAINAVKPGIDIRQIDNAARKVLADRKLPIYGHGTGHGIGLDVHEMPFISQKIKDKTLQSGNIITIEPGIYIPDKGGVRIEDDVIVTEEGLHSFSDMFRGLRIVG